MVERENIGRQSGLFYFVFVCVHETRKQKEFDFRHFGSGALLRSLRRDVRQNIGIRVKSSKIQPGLEIYVCKLSV